LELRVDPDWSIWYAEHLLEQGFEKLLDAKLLKSDLIYLLVLADNQQLSEAPGAHWENYYADFFVSRYLKCNYPGGLLRSARIGP
jgi:hypothetical protein